MRWPRCTWAARCRSCRQRCRPCAPGASAAWCSCPPAPPSTGAGMSGMARPWALELAPEGITVNVGAPGPVRTDMYRAVVPAGSAQERALVASLPVQRPGEAADVARAVRFFTDAGSGFVTGQVLYVCGGTSVGGLLL